MAVTVRRYAATDLDTLIDLFRQSVRRIARKDYTDAQILAWAPDDIDRAAFGARRDAKPTWVAEISGMIVGFTDLEPDGHIDMLFVHPEGQGRGVARALLDTVERTAQERGLARLYAEASITARPVFERYGFCVITAQTVSRNGQDFTNYRMEKKLRP
jgi:putative acetyltransferase